MSESYMFSLPCFEDTDGKLGTIETDFLSGFQIKRLFYIFDVPTHKLRADHACMNASTVFIAISGSVCLSIETNNVIKKYILSSKKMAVYAPATSWIKAYNFSEDAVLLGLSNREYRNCKYIDDYYEYKHYAGKDHE